MSAKGAATYPVSTIAKLLMLTDRRVQQLSREGVLPKAERGRYELAPVVQAYIRYLREEQKQATAAAADNSLRAAREREIQQRMAIRDRQLIDIAEHDAVFDEAFGMLKAELIGIPARVTRDVALRQTIEAEVDGALNRASARFQQASEELRATGQASVPAAEDDAG